jgi:hypothetical protein
MLPVPRLGGQGPSAPFIFAPGLHTHRVLLYHPLPVSR